MRVATAVVFAATSASLALAAPQPFILDALLGGLLSKIKALAGQKCVIIKQHGGGGQVVPRPPTQPELCQCLCPKDNYGDAGVHINQGDDWYQCAYPHGACTWSDNGALQNTAQTNCPTLAPCTLESLN